MGWKAGLDTAWLQSFPQSPVTAMTTDLWSKTPNHDGFPSGKPASMRVKFCRRSAVRRVAWHTRTYPSRKAEAIPWRPLLSRVTLAPNESG